MALAPHAAPPFPLLPLSPPLLSFFADKAQKYIGAWRIQTKRPIYY